MTEQPRKLSPLLRELLGIRHARQRAATTNSKMLAEQLSWLLATGYWLLHIKQFDFEHERGVWRNHAAGAASAVTQMRRNRQHARAANLHAGHALIPSGNHFARTKIELERLTVILRAVELGAFVIGLVRVVQPAGVMHAHRAARPRFRARARGYFLNLQVLDAAVGHGCALLE